MRIQYPILIEKGTKGNAWGVIVPDLPDCFSAADAAGMNRSAFLTEAAIRKMSS
ncbi:type II toxin-antitoxin system HicB family antitoxin [Nitrosomonas sp.]|uniref:type II toxin-antitoxin system HicB family antitoxin n=1 Tax=Nitrosomonas sp. TaxID=42353 RepID=UPI002613BA2A|nr:type II toxin-antitoxin system HicB family antitoxin [Nitrosomonas sp.]